jgi:hypothetical protein
VETENSGRIISATPGRLRVRVDRRFRGADLMHRVNNRLEGQSGVDAVTTSATTGSVLVHYDRRDHSTDDILALLRDAGFIVLGVTTGEIPPEPGNSEAATSIVAVVDELDRRLSAYTGSKVDLKLLFPLTLGGIGVWQWLKYGPGFSTAPAYLLLWYAFDSFVTLYGRRQRATQAGDEPGRPAF